MALRKNIAASLPIRETNSVNDLVIICGEVDTDDVSGKPGNSSFEVKLRSGTFPSTVCIAEGADLAVKANIEIASTAKIEMRPPRTNKETVKQFLETVRSAKAPEKAGIFMADTVLAHQMNAEEPTTIKRTPQDYSEHVKDFLLMYGHFTFEITELLSEGDKVYVRWIQVGTHLTEIDGYAATGKPLTEIASAVYRLENNKIVEYWIQIDRLGFEKQLQRNR